MRHSGLKCLRCNTAIFSNSRHDFVECACGAYFVDGGFDYLRAGGLTYIPNETIFREVDKETLPDHYYNNQNKTPKKWTREQCMSWNKEHWDIVGEETEKRLAWWETVRGTEGYGASREIDI